MDLNYTDRPFVVDTESGVRVPRNGFKGCGDSYTVNDVWLAERDVDEFAVTPEQVLKLKTCFDRINRKVKKETCDASAPVRCWRRKRERLRSLFNNRYLRLRQLVIKTRYRYSMRRYIVTPPIRQCTHQYDTVLRRLCRLDGLSPQELQTKRLYLQQRDRDWGLKKRSLAAGSATSSAAAAAAAKPRHTSSAVNNASLQALWKTLTDTELMNKSIKDQTQGGKSFLKQVVIPGKMLNCLYGKVLPDPTLQPDEIGIPSSVMEGAFDAADMNKVAAIVKRDPVFSSDAITTFTRVVRNPYPYITLPSEIITNKQLDFDGDNVSIMMVHSGRCYIETLVRLSAKIVMYCYFYRTRLTFSQTNGFRIAGFLRHLREVMSATQHCDGKKKEERISAEEKEAVRGFFGATFAHCRYRAARSAASTAAAADLNVSQQLGETLLSLSQQYGPFVAYGFMANVRSLSFTGYNGGRIYPIGPDPKSMAMHIAESGSKGTRDAVERMFDMSTTAESRSVETLDYAKTFIGAKSLIRKQGHNAKKMDSAFQNIIVDHDDHLTLRVNNVIYDLGHIMNYMQREWIMSDLTTECLLEGVREHESEMRQTTLAAAYRPATATVLLSRPPPPPSPKPSHLTTDRYRLLATAPFGNNRSSSTTNSDRYYYWDEIIEKALYGK